MLFLWKLLRCFVVWRMRPDMSRFKEAQVIIGYGFGDYGNQAMANLIRKLVQYHHYSLPLALQWDIAQYLPDDMEKLIVVERHRELGVDGNPLYLDTEEVSAQVANKCLPQGLKKVIIVAHPDHYRRCVWNAQAHGFEVMGVLDTSWVPYGPATGWASKNRFRFTVREILARLVYLNRGWV